MEQQEHLLDAASVTEEILRRQLAEAQADAAAWRDAAQHDMATGEVKMASWLSANPSYAQWWK